MPQSLSKIYLHLVFSTKNREPWLNGDLRSKAFAYLATIGRDLDTEIFRVGGTADHVHLAALLPRTLTVADLVQKLKTTSSVWIKDFGNNHSAFGWQAGYGAFSLGESQLAALVAYIDRQEDHHRTKTFQEEYRELLKRYKVEYDERFVWD